ncbi:hypothetical protein [Azospirillum sp. ST 5-10]|uniref:hypothetical protein n=1 Tax=unclassified Azospirillum TaxID=2630922 RepID=UPI003F49C93D
MRWRGSIFDGIAADDGFKARMKALADRGRTLARGFVRRSECRVRVHAAAAAHGAYARPVNVKMLYHDRARGAFPNSVAVLANYLAKEGPLFDREQFGVDKDAIAAAWSDDRRVFHVIVSPNDGHRIDDMVTYGRDVMAAWEGRVGRLEWVASIETKPDMAHPQGNKHLHVMIRGVQDERDLFFERDVVTHWLRHDAVEVTTRTLGWMDERERQAYERQLDAMARRREERARARDDLPELGGREL